MCVIIYNPKAKKIEKAILQNSARLNPDGAGVYWLDSKKLEYFPSSEFKKLHKARPFIAHFRFATVGAVTDNNRQPVEFDNSINPSSHSRNYLFFHNGTIPYLGNEKESDSVCMAKDVLSYTSPKAWSDLLSTYNSRFATVEKGTGKVEIFNRSDWTESDGVLYSKANVLNKHTVAVYGTLRKGNSNYRHYLTKSKYIGQGLTFDRFRMVCPSSIPFVHPEPSAEGLQIVVDVFEVDSNTLASLDLLEGHPNWYCREQTKVVTDTGQTVTAWIYFNDLEQYRPPYINDYNTQTLSSVNQYSSAENMNWNSYDDPKICFDCYTDLKEDEYSLGDYYCPNCYAYEVAE